MVKGSENGTSPAVNWFFNDWQGGTMVLTRHQKGCYMDLLTAQFNHGHLSMDAIRTVLGSDFGQAWPALQKKFKTDTDGLYYNDRLEKEINKRKKYSKSQSERRSGKSPVLPGGNGNGKGNGLEEGKGGEGEIYREFAHLQISTKEVSKLLDEGYRQEAIDDVLERVENYRDNKKYTSLYLTARRWLKTDKDKNQKYEPTGKNKQGATNSGNSFGDL